MKVDVSIKYEYASIMVRVSGDRADGTKSHIGQWRHILTHLKSIGWKIYTKDQYRNGGQYSCLGKNHRAGKKEFCGFKLEVDTDIYPTGMKFEFYQNHNFENPAGGQYDCYKYLNMPYLLKKAFELTTSKIKAVIESDFPGCSVAVETMKKLPVEEYIINHFRKNSFTKKKINNISEIPSMMSDYDLGLNSIDRDGNKITCGDVKYSYGWTGVLQRGTVYHNINNMWWFYWNDSHVSNIASFDLFDLTDEHITARRKRKHNPPREFVEMREQLSKCSIRELQSEIKRRLSAGSTNER